MSRGLGWFIVILSATVVAFVGVLVWYGTDFLFFASDTDLRDETLTLLYLERMPDGAANGGDPISHLPVMTELVESSGGTVLWQGQTRRVEVGSIRDEWTMVLLFSLRRGADAVDLLTSPVYRQLDEELGDRELGVWALTEVEPLDRPAYTLHLVSADADASAARLASLAADAAAFGAQTLATEPLRPVIVQGASSWSAVGIHHFVDPRLREGFFGDPRTSTKRTINARRVDREVVVLVERVL